MSKREMQEMIDDSETDTPCVRKRRNLSRQKRSASLSSSPFPIQRSFKLSHEKAIEKLMHETQEDFQYLQALLDRSIEQAGTFLRQSFQMPEHCLSARQVVHFWQGMQTIALATVTSQGEPRVAPIGAWLFRGYFYIPTVATAVRSKHIMHHPAISFTYYQGNDLAIIAHGEATIILPDHSDFIAVETLQREQSGHSVRERGEGLFLQIIPKALYTFARSPDQYFEG